MTTVEVLKAARAKLKKRGVWMKVGKAIVPPPHRACAAVAIGRATEDWEDAKRILQVFRKANAVQCIGDWNDAPERTLKDVLEAFDRAIALAEVSQGKPEGET